MQRRRSDMSEAINVIAVITAHAGEEKTVAQALQTAVSEVQGELGCESYVLHQNINNPLQFIMLERWQSQQHLDAHEKAAPFQKLAGILADRASLEITLAREVTAA